MNSNKTFLFACIFGLICFNALAAVDLNNPVTPNVDNEAIFNLLDYTQKASPFSVIVDDKGANVNVSFTIGNANVPGCLANTKVWSTALISATPAECEVVATSDPVYSFLNTSNPNDGLVISYPKNASTYQLTVVLKCDASITSTDTAFSFTELKEGNVTVTGASKYGCPTITRGQLMAFITNNKIPFVIGFVVLGLFVAFFGLKLFHITVFIITAVLATGILAFLLFSFVGFSGEAWLLWVLFGVSVVAGLGLGYMAVKFEKVGFFALGAGLGVIGGFTLFNVLIAHFIDGKVGHAYYLYGTVGVCALIGGLLAFWLWKDIIIIATSVIGAYMAIRGLSFVIGYFPDEYAVAEGLQKLNLYAYIYLGVMVVVALLAMYYQFREKKRAEEEEEDPVANYYNKA